MVAIQEITSKKGNLKSSSDTRPMNNVFHKDNLKEKQILVQENKSKKDCDKDDVQFPFKNNLNY